MLLMPSTPNFVDKTIWTGDNLDILRGLNSETVDLIYLDPPFNSNKDYAAPVGSKAAGAAFKDTWTLSDLDVAWMGLIADEHPPIAYLLDTAGKVHGKGMQSYLTMMAVRLLEMRRLLKPTGSIYLHCDPTASHYLKMLMDAVFGAASFRNDLIWRRHAHSHSLGAKQWPAIHDVLLMYSKGTNWTWNTQYEPYSDDYIKQAFKHSDERGWYQVYPLTGARPGGSEAYASWRDRVPGPGRAWALPRYSLLPSWLDLPDESDWQSLGIHTKLDLLDELGMIHWPRKMDGQPALKRYLPDAPGKIMEGLWVDIGVRVGAKEAVGYPTQKPLALLERIIAASSNEGDVVLDPFCGCATACVAAETLGRKWLGIDISPKAAELVNERLKAFMGDLFHNRLVTVRTDVPRRTDIEAPKNYRQNVHVLFGQQEGRCAGCKTEFPFKILEVDHVVPRSKGGTDHIENLQLLCPHCNRLKGDRPQEYLLAELHRRTPQLVGG